MSNKYYGALYQNELKDNIEHYLEEIKFKGYSIIKYAIDDELVANLRASAIHLNLKQNEIYGNELLDDIGENNQVRLPLLLDPNYLEVIQVEPIKAVLDRLFAPTKSFYVLNQQNIIINSGDKAHNQSSWHRDFPYLVGVSSIPQAYSVLIALDDFSLKNGGTRLLTGSHLHDQTPSWDYINREAETVECKAGSAIIFNSQVFHASGLNKTQEMRIAINNVFTNPLYRQQIDIPAAMHGSKLEPTLGYEQRRLLGYMSRSAISDKAFKIDRKAKKDG